MHYNDIKINIVKKSTLLSLLILSLAVGGLGTKGGPDAVAKIRGFGNEREQIRLYREHKEVREYKSLVDNIQMHQFPLEEIQTRMDDLLGNEHVQEYVRVGNERYRIREESDSLGVRCAGAGFGFVAPMVGLLGLGLLANMCGYGRKE